MTRIKTRDPQQAPNQTHWLLEQWARWAWVNPDFALGYPSATPFRRQSGSTVPSPLINDDDAMIVDKAVARLRRRHPDMGSAVSLYYLNACNVSRVARSMKIHRKKASMLVKTGTAWLDAALEMTEST